MHWCVKLTTDKLSAVSYESLSHSRHNAGGRSTKVGHEITHIIVQILDEKRSLCNFKPSFGSLWQRTQFILGSLESSYDFIFVLTELISLRVTAEAQRANIDWKSAFLKGVRGWSVSAKFPRIERDVHYQPLLHGEI